MAHGVQPSIELHLQEHIKTSSCQVRNPIQYINSIYNNNIMYIIIGLAGYGERKIDQQDQQTNFKCK